MGDRLELRLVADEPDREFARELTRQNMSAYVERHWGAWSPAVFFENFAQSENAIGWLRDERISLLRWRQAGDLLVIEDLQVLTAFQNKGHGRGMLQWLAGEGLRRGCRAMRLRVFDDNPARRLYEVLGFLPLEREGEATWMERALPG